MQNNKLIGIAAIIVATILFLPQQVVATSGACSSHYGVNCNAGDWPITLVVQGKDAAHWMAHLSAEREARGWDSSSLHCLCPTGIISRLHQRCALMRGNKKAAKTLCENLLEIADKQGHRLIAAEATLGLLQCAEKISPKQLQQLERRIRAVGSRKLRAKFLMLEALQHKSLGVFDPRPYRQSINILTETGLQRMQNIFAALAGTFGNQPKQSGAATKASDRAYISLIA